MYEKIKAFCDSHDITIEQFEKVADLKENYVYKLQTIKCPSAKKAKRIAQVLGCSVEELLDEDKE